MRASHYTRQCHSRKEGGREAYLFHFIIWCDCTQRHFWWRLEPLTSEGFCMENKSYNNYRPRNDQRGSWQTKAGMYALQARRGGTQRYAVYAPYSLHDRPKPTMSVSCVYLPPLSHTAPLLSKNHEKHINEPHCCTGWHVPSFPRTHTLFYFESILRTLSCCYKYSPERHYLHSPRNRRHSRLRKKHSLVKEKVSSTKYTGLDAFSEIYVFSMDQCSQGWVPQRGRKVRGELGLPLLGFGDNKNIEHNEPPPLMVDEIAVSHRL